MSPDGTRSALRWIKAKGVALSAITLTPARLRDAKDPTAILG